MFRGSDPNAIWVQRVRWYIDIDITTHTRSSTRPKHTPSPHLFVIHQATSLGTKAAFLRDPLDWYNDFWFPLFSHAYTRCPPNAGHEAIAR